MNITNYSIVIRHSIREPIFDVHDSFRQMLTIEGCELANKLGRELGLFSKTFSIYHSPFPRCLQTANEIKKGIEYHNIKVEKIQEFEPLGIFYNVNFKSNADLFNKIGNEKYLQMWLNNNLPRDLVIPIKTSAEYMLSEISNLSNNNTNIFITHDWNIFCLQSLFFDSFNEMKIPDYLEGVYFYGQNNEIHFFNMNYFFDNL